MATQTLTSYSNRGRLPTPKSNHWISNQALVYTDYLLLIAGGCATYPLNPEVAIKGAMSGAIVRLLFPKNIPFPDENAARANRIASICLTLIAVAFACFTPGPHTFIPLFLCFSAAAEGTYGILRRFAN